MLKKKIIVVIALLSIAVVAFTLWSRNDEQQGDSLTLKLYGNVDIREVELAINGSERIARMLVQEGAQVSKGELLAVLETQRLEALVAQAEAQLAGQQAVVDRLLAGSLPEEISKAENELIAAQALEHDALITQQRLSKLLKQELVSPEDVDHAVATFEATRARRKAAVDILSLVRQGPRVEDIAAAQAALKAYQAQLSLAQHNLEDASLYASADGIIRDRILEPGDMASPQRPLYTLALTDPVWVRSYVSGPDLGRVRPGMKAEVSTDSFPDKKYQAWIGYISPTAEFTPKSVETQEVRTQLVYQMRVFVCNPQGELRLGMPAVVYISMDQNSRDKKNEVMNGEPCDASR